MRNLEIAKGQSAMARSFTPASVHPPFPFVPLRLCDSVPRGFQQVPPNGTSKKTVLAERSHLKPTLDKQKRLRTGLAGGGLRSRKRSEPVDQFGEIVPAGGKVDVLIEARRAGGEQDDLAGLRFGAGDTDGVGDSVDSVDHGSHGIRIG